MNENRTVIEQTVEPKAGRVVIFSSGKENPHYVDRVTSGSRYVLAFWFTCDPERKFEIFLDGKSHTAFSNVFAERLQIQANEYERKKKEKLSKKKKISKKESKAKKIRKSGDDL